ncbi:NUDIX domain-containing protein [Cellulomonas triticagri]|uniref:NUDIX domain-containing protein n=1 Tax=Cellulomonas triticagri TaxID=2483352 RepID=A0A3M2JPF2_9CELL|nr:NUDIX domain-containing protein [Cellulomonas triticagri]
MGGPSPSVPGSPSDAAAGVLGDGWVLGDDGLRYRRAARVLLLDADDRLLLVRGHDVDQPERSWWFTVGGGIDPGESAPDAALREVREETGLVLDPGALVGPVLTRTGIFDFYAQRCRQDEEFFLARVDHALDTDAVDRVGWTALEQDVLDELRWWDLAELDVEGETREVFPEGLADLVRGLLTGWDGVVRHLGDQVDDAGVTGE